MTQWQPLQPGDLVEIIAPGMPPKKGTLNGIPKFLKTWGLKPIIRKDLLGKDLICANSQEKRMAHLKKALSNKEAKMIWCMRGGYGSLHLLPELKKIRKTSPKIFMGLSDITSLHTFLVQMWGWSTIHGCNIDKFARGEATSAEMNRFKKILFGEETSVSNTIKPLNKMAQKNGTIKGSIIGGNLITLQSSFGTPFQMKTRNQILFFEDIGERAYRVDRVLTQMDQLGMFRSVKAVIFGQFTGGNEPGGASKVPQLLKQFAQAQKFPVFSNFPSGHGNNQHPLPLGTQAKIFSGKTSKIEIHTGAK